MREISPKHRRRKTQLVEITREVQEALEGANGASAALVLRPAHDGGVTIQEHADPAVARDLEAAMERIVGDDWGWQHIEDGEENAPSHVRAALAGPQVLVPVEGDSSRSARGRASSSASSTARARGRSTSRRSAKGMSGAWHRSVTPHGQLALATTPKLGSGRRRLATAGAWHQTWRFRLGR